MSSNASGISAESRRACDSQMGSRRLFLAQPLFGEAPSSPRGSGLNRSPAQSCHKLYAWDSRRAAKIWKGCRCPPSGGDLNRSLQHKHQIVLLGFQSPAFCAAVRKRFLPNGRSHASSRDSFLLVELSAPRKFRLCRHRQRNGPIVRLVIWQAHLLHRDASDSASLGPHHGTSQSVPLLAQRKFDT
jgi:hypothetical protein